jgi:hypothetical protein
LCLAKYSDDYEIAIARCVVTNEHPDNDRFAADCERWLGQPIINLKSTEYADCWEVWESARFLVSTYGAPCTGAMRKAVRFAFEAEWNPDVQAYGYTAEEAKRAEQFRKNNPGVVLLAPLIDEWICKGSCLSCIERASIEPPAMYKLGFNNNNCIGCVKGGMWYWNRIRVHFPDVFDRTARLERSLNHSILRQDASRSSSMTCHQMRDGTKSRKLNARCFASLLSNILRFTIRIWLSPTTMRSLRGQRL